MQSYLYYTSAFICRQKRKTIYLLLVDEIEKQMMFVIPYTPSSIYLAPYTNTSYTTWGI